jgi:ADP-heptose:LPS heptosyltransferase
VALDGTPTVVVLRALGLGDLLTAVPALRGLARAYPAHRLVLAAPQPLAPLVELAGWELAPVGELEPLPVELHGADVVVNLHGRGPQSHRLVRDAHPGRALWFEHHEIPESHGSPPWTAGEHEVARWCRLLRESGVAANPAELSLDPPPGPAPGRSAGATLIHPGAASAARRWPVDHFAAVARAEADAGHRVVVTGSRAEAPLAHELAARAELPADAVLAGSTDLEALARAVAAAERVVCGDTGVAHMATAFGTPSVLLFGPTSPAEWGPPPGCPRHRVLWAGRTGDPHSDAPDSGLLELGVEDALEAIAELATP